MKRILGMIVLGVAALGCAADSGESTPVAAQNKNTGWSKIWDTGVTQISAPPAQTDTVFVLFDSGALWEHGGTDKNTGWSQLWDTGIVQISACLS